MITKFVRGVDILKLFVVFLPKPSWYLVPIIGLIIKCFATFSPNVLLSLEDNLPNIFLSHSLL